MHKSHNNGHDMRMMRMMMLCCALLLLALSLAGSNFASGPYFWPVIIGAFVLMHVWMLFRGHGDHEGRRNRIEGKYNKKHAGHEH